MDPRVKPEDDVIKKVPEDDVIKEKEEEKTKRININCYLQISSYKSRHSGLNSFIKFIFQALR